MSEERSFTSRRFSILTALSEVIKGTLNGTNGFSDVYNNVEPRMLFWDEVTEYPAVHMALGRETRIYQGGGYKDRYLTVTIRCYIKDEESQGALELLLEDLETVIEQNGRLAYQDSSGTTQYTRDILLTSIDTDEGALAPLAVGEMMLRIQY